MATGAPLAALSSARGPGATTFLQQYLIPSDGLCGSSYRVGFPGQPK